MKCILRKFAVMSLEIHRTNIRYMGTYYWMKLLVSTDTRAAGKENASNVSVGWRIIDNRRI